MSPGFESRARHPYLEPFLRLAAPDFDDAWRSPPDHAALDACFARARAARFPDEPARRFAMAAPKSGRRKKRSAPVDVRRSYDGRITLDHEVPTRVSDVHDFCNFLAWLAFPRTKRAIHERQFAALERWIEPGSRRIPGARTREQDALTLFDEGGVVICGQTALLREDAELPSGVVALAFGHALLEHFVLRENEIAATAIVLPELGARAPIDAIDGALACVVRSPDRFRGPGQDALVLLRADGSMRVLPRRASPAALTPSGASTP